MKHKITTKVVCFGHNLIFFFFFFLFCSQGCILFSSVNGLLDGGRPTEVEVFVNVHSHPKTGFTCDDKNSGEYYADPLTKCAVYYICLQNQYGKLSPTSFACPNGTIFNQATKVCSSHETVYCDLASRFYDSVRGKLTLIYFE